ncbi:glycosyltransferase family 2 protein [Patescibacteria group bacterium]
MDLSVIIVNHKTAHLLEQCINTIVAKYPELVGNFVIVDNTPTPKTSAHIKKIFPKERYIPSRKNVGFAKAINWGITNTSTKYILTVNTDVIIRDDAISKLYDYLDTHRDVAMVAPQLIYKDGTIQDSCCRFYSPKIMVYRRTFLGKFDRPKKALADHVMEDYDHKSTKDVDWVVGAAMMIRRQAIDDIGLMDERYFLYLEDVDWCRRFWENGWRVVYYPEAKMTHYHARESAEQYGFLSIFNKLTRIHIKSGIKYFWKYRGRKKSPRKLYKEAIEKKKHERKRNSSNLSSPKEQTQAA